MNNDTTRSPPVTGTGNTASPTRQQHWQRLVGKLIGVIVLCGMIVVLSGFLVEWFPGMPWRALAALSPLLALGLFLWIFIGLIRSFDERVQRIELLALVIAAAAVASLWFAAGLLHAAGVIAVPVSQALFLVLPGIFLAYGVVKIILMWRDLRERT